MKRLVVLLMIFMVGFTLALDVEMTTSLDGETGNFIMETSSSAGEGFDAYDVEVPEYPDTSYAQLSSVVSGKNLMLDAFGENVDRTLNLIYEIGSSVNESEELSLTWDSDDFAGYEASLIDCWDDSTCSVSHTTSDMDSSELFQIAQNTYSPHYFKIVLDYQEAVAADPGTTSGGGGGGGGGGVPFADANVKIDTSEININLVVGRTKDVIVNVTNLADTEKAISLSQTNLDGVIVFDTQTISFAPGETKEVVLRFVGPEKIGVYAGIVYIAGIEILTTANVRSKELLFDAMVVVPDKFKKISPHEKLETQITLIPMGDEGARVDVTLNYIIKDFKGNVYLIESETILVDSQKSFKKEFNVGNLVNGNYLIALELVYPNGIATSSSHFSVLDKGLLFGNEIFILIGIILVVLFVLIIWRINIEVGKKRRRRGK
jgi:hypothetical protein